MRVVRILVLTLLLIMLIVLGGGAAVVLYATRAMLPAHMGVFEVPGLRAEVEVLRDDWGVPHIYGSNLHDLFFAQGYVQAQDRWWQMEFSRAIGSGRIQQLIGRNEAAFGQDVFIRTVGWRRLAERDYIHIAPEIQALLQAFADGVNAYISERAPGELALEYTLLGLSGISFDIQPWTPIDTLTWGRALSWNLSSSFTRDINRAILIELYGTEMANDFYGSYDYDNHPTILTPDDLPLLLESTPFPLIEPLGVVNSSLMAGGVTNVYPLGREGVGIGSNSWVVDGSLTESRLPILANDPHLEIAMPSLFYEVGLHCLPLTHDCGLDVVGFALPAAPGVLIGRNQQIAWGVTTSYLDVQDVYRIVINPDNPLQYEWNGGWREMTLREETIHFGNNTPSVTLQVRETHLGVIINDNQLDPETGELTGFNNDDPLVLNWAGNNPNPVAEAAIRLNLAQNWEEFREALRLWRVPSQNFVYADRAGNIGYLLAGDAPMRPDDQSGRVPVLATNDADEWLGFVPHDMMPYILNPERGFIVTANNAIVPPDTLLLSSDYADTLPTQRLQFGDNFASGERAERIIALLDTAGLHSTNTFQRIQGDNMALMAQAIIFPYLNELTIPEHLIAVQETRAFMLDWDYVLNADSAQAAVFGYLVKHLVNETFGDQLPDGIQANTTQLKAIMLLLRDPENTWWDDTRTPDVMETRDDILLRALTLAVNQIAAEQGNNPAEWRWDTLHRAHFVNLPLGASGIGVVESLVNRGPVPTSGGYAVVNAQLWDLQNQQVTSLPMVRVIIDFADGARSLSINSTGQSGHSTSPQYFDQNPLWVENNYRPMLFDRAQVESATAQRMLLQPAEG